MRESSGPRIPRVIGFGLLAEVATAVVIASVLQVHGRLIASDEQAAAAFATRAAAVLNPGLGVLFTYLAALRAAQPIPDRARLHGMLVGVVAAFLTLPGVFAGAPEMRPVFAGAAVLKIAAGWAAGAQIEWKRG